MPQSLSPRTRSRPRRDALLEAAIEVIGEHGVAGTTHRAVTERAGVPLATASYYFSSIGELISEALRQFAAQRSETLSPPARADGAEPFRPAEVAEWAAERFIEVPKSTRLAFFEMVIGSARHQELAEPKQVALRSYYEAAQAGLAALDCPQDPERARALVALCLGFSLLRLADPQEDDRAQLGAALYQLFSGQGSAQE
ncbi:TetR/AcrR family transcriptional regulator [Amycolatopsis aidingensis]|uniref:TetR/AcrR family transcriptional regulator n=1 Tax=Amycolatopsis aidingensis TaxID=2842453 RepID=UPI001C0D59DE|nr:TetR family transcriptional regulator [Amycolatopsis aidingensis]